MKGKKEPTDDDVKRHLAPIRANYKQKIRNMNREASHDTGTNGGNGDNEKDCSDYIFQFIFLATAVISWLHMIN